MLGHAYAVSGRKDEARAVIEQLNELSKHSYVSPYRVAAIYIGLGEKEQAFAWLDRAYEERDGWLIWLNLDPVLDPVRTDKRFKNLLRKVGLAGASAKPARRRASKAITSKRTARVAQAGRWSSSRRVARMMRRRLRASTLASAPP